MTTARMTIGHIPRMMFSFGSDPELFAKIDGKVLPAWEFLPSKKKPLVDGVMGSGTVQAFWDGFQAEFSVTPSNCLAHPVDLFQLGLKTVLRSAQNLHPDAKIVLDSVVEIPKATLRAAPEEYVLLGCDPSQNAYQMGGEWVMDGRKLPYRFAGGHIHFGGIATTRDAGEFRMEKAIPYVKALDSVLGVFCVAAFASFDNPIRRRYYGLAGEFRLPEHGIEYRTLSNSWLCHPGISHLIFELARAVASFQKYDLLNWIALEEEVVHIINTCDYVAARKLLRVNEHMLREIFSYTMYNSTLHCTSIDQALRVAFDGVESIVQDPTDLAKNWKLMPGAPMWQRHSEGPNANWRTTSISSLQGCV